MICACCKRTNHNDGRPIDTRPVGPRGEELCMRCAMHPAWRMENIRKAGELIAKKEGIQISSPAYALAMSLITNEQEQRAEYLDEKIAQGKVTFEEAYGPGPEALNS